jgi:hypothetical protein
MIQVTRTFKTNFFPFDDAAPEVVLELADGRAVYINPGLEHEVCTSLEKALAFCCGEPEESVTLANAWGEGYRVI